MKITHHRVQLLYLLSALAISHFFSGCVRSISSPTIAKQEAAIAAVCFSPDQDCPHRLTSFIDSATQSIDIAIFDINLQPLVRHLIEKAQKIPVRIVVDKRQAAGKYSGFKSLLAASKNSLLQIKYGRQRGIMHNKFTIVDGVVMETGSFNYTKHAAEANQENQIYLADPTIISTYQRRFEFIWKNGREIN